MRCVAAWHAALLLSSFVLMVLTLERHALAHAPPAAFVADERASAASPGQLAIDSEFRYYGWQSLLADTLVFALGMGVHPLAFVLLVSTGPVVHAVNQNFLMMGISSGVRGLAALRSPLASRHNTGRPPLHKQRKLPIGVMKICLALSTRGCSYCSRQA